jgi:hypothetical protein
MAARLDNLSWGRTRMREALCGSPEFWAPGPICARTGPLGEMTHHRATVLLVHVNV